MNAISRALETYNRLVREHHYPTESAITAALNITHMGPSAADLRRAIAAQAGHHQP